MHSRSRKTVGNAEFRKVFARHAHNDDWGVPCLYDYSAWRIWKAAIRYERKRSAGKTDRNNQGESK